MNKVYQFTSEERRLQESSGVPFAIYQFVDGKIHVLLISDGLVRLTGMDREKMMELFETDMYRGVPEKDVYSVAQAAMSYAKGESETYDVLYRQALEDQGKVLMIHAVGDHMTKEDGTQLAVVRYDDITKALERTTETRRAFESSIEQFYAADENAVCILSKDQYEVLYTNDAYKEILPPKRNYDSGINYWQYFHDIDDYRYEWFLLEHCDKGPVMINGIDSNEPLLMKIRTITWAGSPAMVLRVERQMERFIDELTGLPNQTYFEGNAPDKIESLRKRGDAPACIFYDIDGMKLFNAQNGFEQGDKLLCEVAKILDQSFEKSLVARFANDNFCVITEDDMLEEKLLQVSQAVGLLGGISRVEIKAGVFRIGDDVPSKIQSDITSIEDNAKFACDSILGKADQYYKFHDEQLAQMLADEKYITDHFDSAVEKGEVVVYLQPIIRTLSHQLCGFEALARWNSSDIGFLPPYRFITALENTHQIHKLDSFVIQEVCRQLRKRMDAGQPTVPVSFNLSRLDFQACDMFRVLQEATARYDIPHSMMKVEITESTLAEDKQMIREEMERFHGAGYEVWMDDFGSGYSSLNTLQEDKFDKLKIDMDFLRSFTDRSKNIIESIVQMAKKIGIKTLAEGVETEEQFEFLVNIGCEEAQGYYFDKPQPFEHAFDGISEMGITAETQDEAFFYRGAGKTEFRQKDAMAMMEYDGEEFHFLFYNDAYNKVLQSAGMPEATLAMDFLNNESHAYYVPFRARMKESAETQEPVHFAFSFHDTYLTMSLEVLSELDERKIVKAELTNAQVHISSRSDLKSEAGKEGDQAGNTSMAAPESEEHKRTLLIVDDESINTMILNEMLKDHYNLIFAENGKIALSIATANYNNISAIMLDMVMPEMDGMQFLQVTREDPQLCDIPIIAMTSATDMQEAILTAGAAQFMAKPFEPLEIILAKLENVIKRAEDGLSLAAKSLEYIPGGILIYKAEGDEEILYANRTTIELFECGSYSEFMELTGGTFKGVVYEPDYERVQQEIDEQINGGENDHDHVFYRIQTRRGLVRQIDDFGRLVDDPVYGKIYYVFIGRNMETDSLNTKRTIASAMVSEDGIFHLNGQDAIRVLSQLNEFADVVRLVEPNKCKVMEILSDGSMIEEEDHCFKVWNKDERCENCISQRVIMTKGREAKFEYRDKQVFYVSSKYMEIDNKPYALEIVHHIQEHIAGQVPGYKDLIASMNQMTDEIYEDSLTDSKNRKFFDDKMLNRECDAVAMIDVDHFKEINDTFGHHAGDHAIQTAVKAINSCIRDTDILVRYGGDEFIVFFDEMPKKSFVTKLEMIRERVSKAIVREYPTLQLHVSIGGICEHGSVESLVLRADEALYEAKKERNKVFVIG